MPKVLQAIFTNFEENPEISCQYVFDVCPDTISNKAEKKSDLPSSKMEAIKKIYEKLSSTAYMENQISLLTDSICPNEAWTDPDECIFEINTYWESLAKGYFSPMAASEYCEEGYGNCATENIRYTVH